MSGSRHLAQGWFLQGRLKLRHLLLLDAIERHGKLHLAAAALGLTQPAASKLLTEVEAAIGRPLFARRGRGLEPNAFGAILIRRAHAVLRELDGAREEVNALGEGHAGRVAIGTIDAAAIGVVTPLVTVAQRLHPRIEIELRTGSSHVLLGLLSEGELDLVFGRPVGEADGDPFRFRELGVERLAVIARRGHGLLRAGGVVGPAELREASWVLQGSGSALRRRVEDMFLASGFPLPARIVSTDSPLMTLACVMGGEALSVVTDEVARPLAASGAVDIVPIEATLSAGPFGLVVPALRPPSPATATILALLDAVLAGGEVRAVPSDPSGSDLLRLSMMYGPGLLSLRGTAAVAADGEVVSLSDKGVLGRLRKMGDWLEHLLQRLLEDRCGLASGDALRLSLVDGSVICAPGATGTDWRLHARFDPDRGRFGDLVLTAGDGGERVDRTRIEPGTIVLQDRGYARVRDFRAVLVAGADFITRTGWRAVPMTDPQGLPINVISLLRDNHVAAEHLVHAKGIETPLRLIVQLCPRPGQDRRSLHEASFLFAAQPSSSDRSGATFARTSMCAGRPRGPHRGVSRTRPRSGAVRS